MTQASAPSDMDMATLVAQQVERRLEGHAASEEAFVVSLYGEWGVGKTYCLKGIRSYFASKLSDPSADVRQGSVTKLVVPVFFDPWQYEHEEHLVIPLLKTIEHELNGVAERIDQEQANNLSVRLKQGAGSAAELLTNAARVFGDVAVSLLSGFKLKAPPLMGLAGLDMEFSPKDALDAARKASEKREAPRSPESPWRRWFGSKKASPAQERLARYESIYFDVQSELKALIKEQNGMALRLVVLIDDLDRCLPEKAVQILESVKLFLNIPGFSFVLAVDDEVVERGIAHRYQSYGAPLLGQGRDARPPITGAEYLEKIVHLPVHLQRWTRGTAEAFLRAQYGQLFGLLPKPSTSAGGAPKPQPPNAIAEESAPSAPRANELLALLLGTPEQPDSNAVPLVPRKLIRLAEALEFQHEQFSRLGAAGLWAPLHAARLVALQQLFPPLYRHLRLKATRYWRLFDITRNALGEATVAMRDELGKPIRGHDWTLARLRRGLDVRANGTHASASAADNLPSLDDETMAELMDLLRLVDEACAQRGQVDPLRMFPLGTAEADRDPKALRQDLGYAAFAELYFQGVAPPKPPVAPSVSSDDMGPVAQVIDPDGLIQTLLLTDTLTRRGRLEELRLQGRLPDEVFTQLLDALRGQDAGTEPYTQLDWLRDIAALTSPEQLLRLYEEHQVLDALLKEPSHAS